MADTNINQEDSYIFNGLNGATGGYLLPEMTSAQLSKVAQGQSLDQDETAELKQRAFELQNPHAGVEADARILSDTGWGVIFAHDSDPAIREVLKPLLDLRQEQAGDYFKIFEGADGYRPGESKGAFLRRHKMGPGPVNPEKVPYYLLVVGDPSTIPYRFQYQMDVQYAVGRIHFETIEEYAYYAQSVVTAEKGLDLPPLATFFGVSNENDRATNMSSAHLVRPLVEKLRAEAPQWASDGNGGAAPSQWELQAILEDQATKAQLGELFNGRQAPALFFSASHGIGFPNGDPRQLPHQGALVCQDWPGPQQWRGEFSEDFYFSGDDLTSDANLLGTLAFFFACYGAGTPRHDEFARQIWGEAPERKYIAPHDFVANLPRRMLSLKKGGALAVVGHIERAWGVSFYWAEAGPQLQVFEDCFERLMKGNYPIGYAAEVFNNRYAEISSDLSDELNEILNFGKNPNDMELANMWTANNDARNYVIIGDPAVRLMTAKETGAQRPVIPEITSLPEPSSTAPQTGVAVAATSIPAESPQAGTPQTLPDDYGLMDSFKQAQASMGSALGQFVDKLGNFLSSALDEATSLEVATYVSEDMSSVDYKDGEFTGANLRALTRIEIDGDTLICVPERDGEVDTELWEIHIDMVKQAQTSRAELLKTVVSAATNLVDLIKP